MANDIRLDADILVIGGGTAGSVAAIRAKEALPNGTVLLLEKANIKRSGAIALGMDGVNNAIIPGHATPDQYVREITMANDGIVNQKAILAYAQQSFAMIQELESWGVKFQKTATGEYDVKKVHHQGSYVLPIMDWPGTNCYGRHGEHPCYHQSGTRECRQLRGDRALRDRSCRS